MNRPDTSRGWDFAALMFASWTADFPDRREGAARVLASVDQGDSAREARQERTGIPIPETLVVSPSTSCDLRCIGCGAKDDIARPAQLSIETLDRVADQSRELGIRRWALVGGEPLLDARIDDFLVANDDILFTVFTNGRSIDDERARRFERCSHLIFIVNVTSGGRGPGELPPGVVSSLEVLRAHRLLYGFAATITAREVQLFSSKETLSRLRDLGSRCAIIFDYLPGFEPEDDPLVVERGARRLLVTAVREFCFSHGMLAICAPEDEDLIGGCGAAGRRLVHLSARGTIDPCPFVPFSPFLIAETTLYEALASDYFAELRTRSSEWEAIPGCSCAYRADARELFAINRRHGAVHRAGAE